jgi:hypothetical protein
VFVPADEGVAVAVDDADAEAAGLEAAALEVLAAELELELELQAAAPTTTTAPMAAIRHLEPLIRRDIPVKRTIAPCRLSAVNSLVYGPSSARCGGTAAVAQN